jgi:CubicO group peptidase (beta-lactamase class C family)
MHKHIFHVKKRLMPSAANILQITILFFILAYDICPPYNLQTMNTLTYLSRCIIRNIPQITGYQHFSNAFIRRNGVVRTFEDARSGWKERAITHTYHGRPQLARLSDLLAQTGSTACIVMQHNRILPEGYFNDYTANPINTSFSVAKSITSTLIGIAQEEGAIHSIRESIGRYIPQYDVPGLRDITIAHLLQMCSGLQVIPAAWMSASVSPPLHKADTQKYLSRLSPPLCKWSSSSSGYYKYLWWGQQVDPHNFDYFALGAKGQFIYICPRKQAVIVRFGKQWGKTDWWPGVLKQIADSLD